MKFLFFHALAEHGVPRRRAASRYTPAQHGATRIALELPTVRLSLIAGLALCGAVVFTEPTGSGDDAAPSVARALVLPSPPARSAAPRRQAGALQRRYVGDLDELRRYGRLRILIPANLGGVFYLPRQGWPVEAQHEAAASFARSQGLEPVLIPVERLADMVPSLLAGSGDVIAANLTITEDRRRQIAFSVPLTTVRQQVLVAASQDAIAAPADLVGRRVMVEQGSSFWERLDRLRESHPGIELVARPPGMSDEEELDAVAEGRVDATVRDSNIAAVYLGYRDDLKVGLELPGVDDIAWGIRPGSKQLRDALNKFLHLEHLTGRERPRHRDGWAGINKRRVLRVLLRNNAASYFLYKGELHGFEYELAKAFADAHGLRLEVVVPDTHEQLLQWLRDGRGDVAAAFLEPDPDLAAAGIAFSRAYHYAPRHLVVRADAEVDCLRDLEGMTMTVRRSSPYWRELLELQAQGAAFRLEAAPEHTETEELITQVAAGLIEATVADGHLLDIELARGLAVKSGLKLSDERAHAVAVRAQDRALKAALDSFIKKAYRGRLYNILYRKYFTNQRNVRSLADGRPGGAASQGLSPYDAVTRRYAERYGFDWRLIVAQMYEESRFDPTAESFAGARGLMQVMPRTAAAMGFSKLGRPEENIHAGIKYLAWVRQRFEPSLPFNERMWFTLAAYNAGHGHVHDARRLARQLGLDGDRWFDHTEKAMLLLSKKQYASKARHGYVRGVEPVSYVRSIRQRYRAYAEVPESRLARRPEAVAGPPVTAAAGG